MPSFDEFYDSDELAFGEDPSRKLKNVLALTEHRGKALDIGAGDGRNSLFLARHGFDVTALDKSKVGLTKLQEIAAERDLAHRITCVQSDVNDWDYPANQFDLIAAVTIFDHLEGINVVDVFDRVTRSLKSAGLLFVKSHTIDDPGYRADQREESELSSHITHYFDHNELLRLVMPTYRILWYDEGTEEDHTHGDPHEHGFAKLLARKM